MKFGVREICNVTFKAISNTKVGATTFAAGQPVLYIDTATTSTLEQAATTVYAQGGRGYSRLIAWEGEKTLTFTVEDALLSPIGFSILSGAGLFRGAETNKIMHFHQTATTTIGSDKKTIDMSKVLGANDKLDTTVANIYVMKADPDDGSIVSPLVVDSATCTETSKEIVLKNEDVAGALVFVDYYILKAETVMDELQIEAGNFAGNYYVEAETLFRRQADGKDMPAILTVPNVKIQSNFTFNMAPTGDPSTFSFTMDAFPAYTKFDQTKKVLCVLQICEDVEDAESDIYSLMEGDTP